MSGLRTLVCSILVTAGIASAGTLDTTVYWDGFSTITPFGKPSSTTYGQTFTSFGGVLTNFTFWLSDRWNGADVRFAAYLMRWDVANDRATGSILYQSAVQVGTASATPVPYTFNANVSLTSGMYIAFLSSAPYLSTITSTTAGLDLGHLNVDVYSLGAFWFQNFSTSNLSSLTNMPWQQDAGVDAAFYAEFVPEPGAVFLAGGGLIGLYFLRRRR